MDLAPAGARRDLALRCGLGQEHRRFEVHGIDAVEARLADLEQRLLDLDADAVDQDVDPPEPLMGLGGRGLDRSGVGDLDRDARDRDLGAGLDRAGEPLGFRPLAPGDHDRGAGEPEPPGDRLAEPAGAARHEGGLAGQVEEPGELGGEIELRRDRGRRVHRRHASASAAAVMSRPR